MDIFWRLILAHLLADFTLQTDYIAAWKRRSILGGFVHSLVFLVCGTALCFGALDRVWVSFGGFGVPGWAALVLLTALHFLEDEWRVWTIGKMKTPDSFLFFVFDQLIHCSLIFVFAPPPDPSPEKTVLYGILLVLITHFTTILLYYAEKGLRGSAKLVTGEKYFSMTERLAVALILLLPAPWAFAFPVVWLARFSIIRLGSGYDFSHFNMVFGNCLAVIFGVLGRFMYYP